MLSALHPRPLIVGLSGPTLDTQTLAILRQLRPVGFILFKRNCVNNAQISALCGQLTKLSAEFAVPHPLIFIDQEGGRVQRIHWDDFTPKPARFFGDMYTTSPQQAVEAVRLQSFIIGARLRYLGITANCAPVADVADPLTHQVIGDRAFSTHANVVSVLAGASISGFLAAGVYPVIKHAPGHGKCRADSHLTLPEVSADTAILQQEDFVPFAENATCPFVMTAHILYTALDAGNCATTSPVVMKNVLRRQLGLTGVIMSDDINMQALQGSIYQRAERSLAAGCDIALHCSGNLAEMQTLAAVPPASTSLLKKLHMLPPLPQAPSAEVLAQATSRWRELTHA